MENNTQFQLAVERAKSLFLENYIVQLGLSGKDSFCALVCVLEGLKQAIKINPYVGPLYVVTTNTTLDNFAVHDYILSLHNDLDSYALQNELPVITRELKPALSRLPIVEYVGMGKLIRTPETGSNRECAVDWKLMPAKRFLTKIKEEHRTDKVISVSGSRHDESLARAASLASRRESAAKPVMTDLGWSLPIIADWSLTDVFKLIDAIDDGGIETFTDNVDGLKKHYSAANGGTCDLFAAGGVKSSKPCSSRFGCTLCFQISEDNSLQGQISSSPSTYGFMQPFVALRRFLKNTLYDYPRSRSLLAREIKKDSWIKVGFNHYSLAYRQELLRYILTIDVREQERAELYGEDPMFQLVDYPTLTMIQYHWAREGGESSPGEAFQIWHEVYTENKRYDIPETTEAKKDKLYLKYGSETIEVSNTKLAYRYLNLNDFCQAGEEWNNFGYGLEINEWQKQYTPAYSLTDDAGRLVEVCPYEESRGLSVNADGGLWEYIESDFPAFMSLYNKLKQEGEAQLPDPTFILTELLSRKLVIVNRGSAPKLHRDAKLAQFMNQALRLGCNDSASILRYSVSEAEYVAAVKVSEKTGRQVESGQFELSL